MEQVQQEEVMREQPSKSTCGAPGACEVFGAVMAVGVLGLWFGIGTALGNKMVNSLEELISR